MAKKPELTKERAQIIRAARDSKDPLHWIMQPGRLGPTQHEYLYSTVLHRHVTGGNRTGKTMINMIDAALCLRGKHPVRKFPGPIRVLFLTETRAQAAQVIGRKLFDASEIPGPMHDLPLIPTWEYNAKDFKTLSVGMTVPYTLKMKNGSEAMWAWSGVDATWKRIQGIEFDLCYPDEDAGSPELMDEVYGRLLISRGDKLKPYGGGIGWSATPTAGSVALTAFRKLCDSEDNPDYAKFHIKAGENPAVSAEALESFREAIGDRKFAVRGTGTKTAGDLVAIYGDQWDDAKHIAEKDHVPTDDDCLWACIDPGFAHPAGILLTALTRDDPHQIKVIEYHDVRGRTMADWLKIVADWLDGRWLDGLVLDRASHRTEYTGKSVFNQIREIAADPASGVRIRNPLMTGRNRHWDGISRVRQYLKPHDRAEPLIKVNPNGYGCGLLVSQMKAYRGRAAAKFTGEGGVIKVDDEAPDCLVGTTLIATSSGLVPISDVRRGDLVHTRLGLRPVTDAWCSSQSAEVLCLTLADGSSLVGTAGHLIWTENRGFVRMEDMAVGDLCLTSSNTEASSSTSTTARAPDTSETERGSCSTGPSGKMPTDPFPWDTTSTTKTGTAATTTWVISFASLPGIIPAITSRKTQRRGWITWLKSVLLQLSGIGRRLVGSGTRPTLPSCCISTRHDPSFAISAARHAKPSLCHLGASAAGPAKPSIGNSQASMTSIERVPSAARTSSATATPSGRLAPSRVVGLSKHGRSQVYDITVEGAHEFLANGILVHNCLRYLVTTSPCWIANGPNSKRYNELRQATTAPVPVPVPVEMPPEVEQHQKRLRLSASRISDFDFREDVSWGDV